MIIKNGYNKSIPSPNISLTQPGITPQLQSLKEQTIIARVKDIVLDDNHPKFKEVGEWNGIGTIFYEINNSIGSNIGTLIAKPIDPYSKIYPLVNELVVLFNLPNQNIGQNTSSTSYFYINPISIWNHPHHNAYPNLLTNSTVPLSQQQDYQQTEGGSIRRISDESSEIQLNSPINPSQNTFVEKTNIHPLIPFAGDIIYEGRYGQSIRFGSTSKSNSTKSNIWSSSGNNGDPIFILRNGQPKSSSPEGWIPIVENISEDLSSLYLTSYQKIPFSISREEFQSNKWINPPLLPSEYSSPQVITNSDRVVINAKNDSILISSQKSIGLSCYDEINLIGKNLVLDGQNVYLGSKNATQSVLKGDDTVALLKEVLMALKNLTAALEPTKTYLNGVPSPNVAVQMSSKTANQIISSAINQLDNLKSSIVKTQ